MKEVTIDEVESAQEALTSVKDQYLRSNGWNHKCNYPGSRWLWEKELPDGRVIAVPTDTAILLQAHL